MSDAGELVPKLEMSNLSAIEGSSESTALQEVSDSVTELRSNSAELAALLSSALDCMKKQAVLADTYHDSCIGLMQKHANSSTRPLQAQLDEATAVNVEMEARVRSLNERLELLEAERDQLQAFKDNITGMVQQSLVSTPSKVAASPQKPMHAISEPPSPQAITDLATSLVPKKVDMKIAAQADAEVSGVMPEASAETTAPDAVAVPAAASGVAEGETGEDELQSAGAGAGAVMDDTVEGMPSEHGSVDAEAIPDSMPGAVLALSFAEASRDGALCLVQLSSGKTVPLPVAGIVLGRSTATQHNLDELGLKVHRKHVHIAVQQGAEGTAAISVQRLGLNAASIIPGKDAQALGLLQADGAPTSEDVDVSSLVAAAEAKDCVQQVGKKHAKSVQVGDVLVLCNSLPGAFLLQSSVGRLRGTKRVRGDEGAEEETGEAPKAAKTE